jgi:NhaA family Na+:H+ antiporter
MTDNNASITVDRFGIHPAVGATPDHIRGGDSSERVTSLVSYGDFLCPYCRRFRSVLLRIRGVLGERLAYVYRHFPNESAHPGAEFAARAAEAAAEQGRFWEMHDGLYGREPPLTEAIVRDVARGIGLDMERFERDIESDEIKVRIARDLDEARRDGVSATPTIFVDGQRYDGAWDFYSLLNVLERPVAERIQRSARAFANLPASGGLVLLLAAVAAIVCVNTPLAPYYHALIAAPFGIGPPGSLLSLSFATWCSDGLLAFFFLIVGLEIRRELTAGSLSDRRAATLPVLGAIGGTIAPAAVYLLFNMGDTAAGWSIPTATNIAFVLGVLALLGDRVPPALRTFVAALAVADDLLSVLILAIFYPHDFHAQWLIGCGLATVALFALGRWRVYRTWPYLAVAAVLWVCLHATGIDAALAGIVLAAFIPAWPLPDTKPLLAQAATALAELEHLESAPGSDGANASARAEVVEWASRNLSAASDRLLSPADRVERAIEPWSTYLVLPLFAFTAAGVALGMDLSSPAVMGIAFGVIAGLVIGKPLGVGLAAMLAIKSRIGIAPEGSGLRQFIGVAFLCGIGDPIALLLADESFPHGSYAATAKIAVLIGSVVAALIGVALLATAPRVSGRTDEL